MLSCKSTFVDLLARFRRKVEEATDSQSLYIVGEGVFLHDDEKFGPEHDFAGYGFTVWFDRRLWDVGTPPEAWQGCYGFTYGPEHTAEAIVEEMKRKWLVPISIHRGLWENTCAKFFDSPWEVVRSKGFQAKQDA